MNRVVPIFMLLVLAGCASGPDKQAALSADKPLTPVPEAPLAMAPIQATPHAADPAIIPVAALPETAPAPAAPESAATTAQIQSVPAGESAGAEVTQASGEVADTPWDDLMRRVTAWANPLRRSMEPYCQDGLTHKP